MDSKDFEGLMKMILSNPISSKRKRVVLNDGKKEEVIFESSRQTVLNNAGMPETEVINENVVLDDGSSITGVSRCQKCQGLVRIQSLHRCPCGRTVCLRRGCGKVWGGRWFCSIRCVIFSKMRLLRKF